VKEVVDFDDDDYDNVTRASTRKLIEIFTRFGHSTTKEQILKGSA